jgi:hypothetical protein
VHLADPKVSAEHASIYFDKGSWYLRDLASTNGTFIDGTRIELGRKNPLSRGVSLGFGAPTPSWVFLHDEPPRMRLREIQRGKVKEPLGGLLVLPSEDHPVSTFYQVSDGWIEERDGIKRILADNDSVECEGQHYIVEIPPPGAETVQTGLSRVGGWASFDEVGMHFTVSRDREAIVLELRAGVESRVVSNRAYHEMLLVLAEERISAKNSTLGENEQGWLNTDELCRRVAGDISKVNVDVFRARQQLDQLGIVEAHRVVERRPATRQLRLGTAAVSITYDAAEPSEPGTIPPNKK